MALEPGHIAGAGGERARRAAGSCRFPARRRGGRRGPVPLEIGDDLARADRPRARGRRAARGRRPGSRALARMSRDARTGSSRPLTETRRAGRARSGARAGARSPPDERSCPAARPTGCGRRRWSRRRARRSAGWRFRPSPTAAGPLLMPTRTAKPGIPQASARCRARSRRRPRGCEAPCEPRARGRPRGPSGRRSTRRCRLPRRPGRCRRTPRPPGSSCVTHSPTSAFTSSGASRSPSAVEPTMSAKRTVTGRRSSSSRPEQRAAAPSHLCSGSRPQAIRAPVRSRASRPGEDRLLELPQLSAGLEAELVGQQLSERPIGVERVRMTTGAVERDHERARKRSSSGWRSTRACSSPTASASRPTASMASKRCLERLQSRPSSRAISARANGSEARSARAGPRQRASARRGSLRPRRNDRTEARTTRGDESLELVGVDAPGATRRR